MSAAAPVRRASRPAASGRDGPGPVLRLVAAPGRPSAPPALDASQRAVVEHPGGPLLVLAGPGTGKTTTVVELVADRVARGLDPRHVLVLTFSTGAAAELRARIGRRLGVTTPEPVARTFHSYAYGILRGRSTAAGGPVRRLLPASEAQVAAAEVLAGLAEGAGRARVDWPPSLSRAVATQGFAAEVTDVLARAAERGVLPSELARLGRSHGRPEWEALARFAVEYEEVLDARFPDATDQAGLVRAALALLQTDPAALAAESATRRLVVVDEFQDCDPGQLALLAAVAGGGRDLVVVGDPDQSIYAFRGTATGAVADFAERFRSADGRAAPTLALSVCRRSGPVLLAASRRVAARLGGPVGHRDLQTAPGAVPGSVAVFRAASAAAEAARIAGWLRALHVRDGRAWSEMAVLTRTRAAASAVRRGLLHAAVPVDAAGGDVPVAEQPAAAALLDLLGVVLDPEQASGPVLDRLLAGPLAGVDAVARRRLRAVAGALGGPDRPAAAVLRAAVDEPTGPDAAALGAAVGPVARLLAGVAAGRRDVAGGADARTVLWSVWEALALAGSWRRAALAGGDAGAFADRHLDSVLALFGQFDNLRTELPGLALEAVVRETADRALPGARSSGAERSGVAVLTVHASKGLEWPVVAVAGVQEQVWPDLRRRGSLLGARDLVRALDDPAGGELSSAAAAVADRAELLAEERRLFYVAVTRAGEHLLVTAVDDVGHQPSRFLDDLDPPVELLPDPLAQPARSAGPHRSAGPDRSDQPDRSDRPDRSDSLGHSGDVQTGGGQTGGGQPGDVQHGGVRRWVGSAERQSESEAAFLDPRELVARLRQEVCAGPGPRRFAAAELLAELDRAGVAGADPDRWWGVLPSSDEAGQQAGGQRGEHGGEPGRQAPSTPSEPSTPSDPTPDGSPPTSRSASPTVSPSRLETLARCPLRWFLEDAGARGAPAAAQTAGTLVHALAQEVATGRLDASEVLDRFRERSAELLAGDGWPKRRERQRFEAMVGRLQTWLVAHSTPEVLAEVRFEAELATAAGPVRVAGTIDRLEIRADGQVRLVDFKTGRPVGPEAVEEHLQLGLYQLAVGSGAPGVPVVAPVAEAVLVQLRSPSKTESRQPPFDPRTPPAWLVAALDDAGRALRQDVFEARPGAYCRSCPVRHCCPTTPEGAPVGR